MEAKSYFSLGPTQWQALKTQDMALAEKSVSEPEATGTKPFKVEQSQPGSP